MQIMKHYKTSEMRSRIDSIRDCGIVLKLERFSYWPWVLIIRAFIESRWVEG